MATLLTMVKPTGGNEMVKRAPNTAKATVWTERSKVEVDGPSWTIAYHVFQTLNREDREKALGKINEWHGQASEAGR